MSAALASRVLFIEGSGWISCAFIVRMLGQEGHGVEIIAPRLSLPWLSRHVTRRYALPQNPDEMADFIRRHLEKERYDRVIIGDEPTFRRLAAEKNLEYPQPIFPVPADPESLDVVLLKTAFLDATAKAGLSVPMARTCRNPESLFLAAKEMGYPLLFKADGNSGGRGIFRLDSDDDLKKSLKNMPPAFSGVLQRFVHGRTGSTCVIYRHGETVAWHASYKSLVHPQPYGQSCVREMVAHPDFPELVEGIGRVTQFDGFAGFDWIHENCSDKIYVLEFGARPTPPTVLFRRSGLDFAEAWKRLHQPHMKLKPVLSPKDCNPAPVWLFPQYPIRLLTQKEWPSYPGLKWSETMIPWDDPLLLLACLKLILKLWVKSLLSRYHP